MGFDGEGVDFCVEKVGECLVYEFLVGDVVKFFECGCFYFDVEMCFVGVVVVYVIGMECVFVDYG